MDGWDFKQYVLGMLFYRYISENLAGYINRGEYEAGNTAFDYAALSLTRTREKPVWDWWRKGIFYSTKRVFCNVLRSAPQDENWNETLEAVFVTLKRRHRAASVKTILKACLMILMLTATSWEVQFAKSGMNAL